MVNSLCDCISGKGSADVAAKSFYQRAAESGNSITGDELVELKEALKDLEESDDGGCCEC
jgi:hypothetical protein